MAKTKEPTHSNIITNSNVNNSTNNNVNNNTNNIHVNVKQPSRAPAKKIEKPNWIFKAFVIALIGAAASVLVYYTTNDSSDVHRAAEIENGAPAITGEKVN